MSNKPGKKKKRDRLKQYRKILIQEREARKQAAAYLEAGEYGLAMSKEKAKKWIFIFLFIISAAGNIWFFVYGGTW